MSGSEVEALQEVQSLAKPAVLEPRASQAVQSPKVLHTMENEHLPLGASQMHLGSPQLPEDRELTTPPEQPATDATLDKPKLQALSESQELQAFDDVAQTLRAATTISPVARESAAANPQAEPVNSASPIPSITTQKSAKAVEEPSVRSPTSTSSIAPPAAASMRRSVPQAAAEPEILAMPNTPRPPTTIAENAAGDSAVTLPQAPTDAATSFTELPKVAAEAARRASLAYVDAGRQAQLTLRDLLSLRDKHGPTVTLTVDQIVTAAFFLLAAVQLLLLPLFMPSTFRLLYSLLCGLLLGLSLSFIFYHNRNKKAEVNELLATSLGLKGVQLVAAGIPAMFNFTDTEKMEWLNTLVTEVWPFVDKAAAAKIKDITAQRTPDVLKTLPENLSGIVKSIGFKHLTFGDAPFRVESIRVTSENENKQSLVLELSVKWCGDPNITLAVETEAGAKLCPRVLDMSFSTTVKVVLRPLVARLPGFVALMATVPKPPLIKYRLDFGKSTGGSAAAASVTPVINFLLRGVLDRRLVWPNRIVVPILQETAADVAEVHELMRRVRGMLRVCVLTGKQLKGLEPTEDAVVELTTDTEYYESTRPSAAVSPEELAAADGKLERLANTELVTWNDVIYLLVQEPESQMLRLQAFDLNTSRSIGKNTAAAAAAPAISSSNRRAIGRALVKLSRVCRAGKEVASAQLPVRVLLGENDWGSPGGPGKGAGTIMLRMSYFPCEDFTKEQVLGSSQGILTVRLLSISGLTPGVNQNVAAYASFNLTSHEKAGHRYWKTARKAWTLKSQMDSLNARLHGLRIANERDLREGDSEAANAKAAEMRALQQEVDECSDAAKNRSRVVTLDFTMETQAFHAFYKVKERLDVVLDSNDDGSGDGTGAGSGDGSGPVAEENLLLIKVVQEGRVKRTAEEIGVAEVPVSRIKNSYCLNPLTGKKEYGLYVQKWRDFDPDNPGSKPPPSEWGLPLSGSASARVWIVARWVPCVEAMPDELNEEEEEAFVNALPSMVKTVQSA